MPACNHHTPSFRRSVPNWTARASVRTASTSYLCALGLVASLGTSPWRGKLGLAYRKSLLAPSARLDPVYHPADPWPLFVGFEAVVALLPAIVTFRRS